MGQPIYRWGKAIARPTDGLVWVALCLYPPSTLLEDRKRIAAAVFWTWRVGAEQTRERVMESGMGSVDILLYLVSALDPSTAFAWQGPCPRLVGFQAFEEVLHSFSSCILMDLGPPSSSS